MRLSQERTQELKKALKEHIKQHGKKEAIWTETQKVEWKSFYFFL